MAWLILLLTVIGMGAAFTLGPSDAVTTDSTGTSLPADSQSARVAEILKTFPSGAVAPAIVVYSNADKSPLTSAQQVAITKRASELATLGISPEASRPQKVNQGVTTVSVLLSTDTADEKNTATIDTIRKAASTGLTTPLRAEVTGGPAFRADITKVFDGADTNLLLATASV
ncbi:MMPL family transporter, partial [Streptomyces adustus]